MTKPDKSESSEGSAGKKVRAPADMATAGFRTEQADGWHATQSRMRLVAGLVPYARNAGTHSTEQVARIAYSIRRWGWTMPVLVQTKTSGIIAGHATEHFRKERK